MLYVPIEQEHNLILGTGRSNTVIVTGWTRKEIVASKLSPDSYLAIGQLYSCNNGVDLLIRNLLANPHVTHLLALSATQEDRNSHSVDCLFDFFQDGFHSDINAYGDRVHSVNSIHKCHIGFDIPRDDLLSLIDRVHCLKFLDLPSLISALHSISPSSPNTLTPKFYPSTKHISLNNIVSLHGHTLYANHINLAWIKALHQVLSYGQFIKQSSGQRTEILNLVSIITHRNDSLMKVVDRIDEFLNQDFMKQYVASFFADNTNLGSYNYGLRMRSWFQADQLKAAINLLKLNRHTTRCVINLWDSKQDLLSDNPPCLNHVWVRVIDNQLNLTALFRSHDIYAAYPYNLYGLLALQLHLINAVDDELQLGKLTIISESAHVYQHDLVQAKDLIASLYSSISRADNLSFTDPVGNFIIEWYDDSISVTKTDKDGLTVRRYHGSNPLILLRSIISDSPSILPTHSGYLGIELHKASILKSAYNQDLL